MADVHTREAALKAPGAVKGLSLELGPGDTEVSVIVEMATEALADAFYEELKEAMKVGRVALGPIVLKATPENIREERGDVEG